MSQVLRLVAHLAAERLPVDLAALYGTETECVGHREPAAAKRNEVAIPVGMRAVPKPAVAEVPVSRAGRERTNLRPSHLRHSPRHRSLPARLDAVAEVRQPEVAPTFVVSDTASSLTHSIAPLIESAANVQVLNMQAQETFLRISGKLMDSAAGVLRFQTALLDACMASGRAGGVSPLIAPDAPAIGADQGADAPRSPVPRALTYEQCCAFAAGKVADALGPLFAEVDSFPTRVRLPDGPLQLVDRITLIEGEPQSMTSGPGRHRARRPRRPLVSGQPAASRPCICVEAGQADLFLSGYLGIDFETRGLAVYRLLDAVVTFHRGLPAVGETVVYDIHIDKFFRQGEAWLFRFRFDGTVNGEPLSRCGTAWPGSSPRRRSRRARASSRPRSTRSGCPARSRPTGIDFVPHARVCARRRRRWTRCARGDLVDRVRPGLRPREPDAPR